MAGTQAALYEQLATADLELSWSEDELPQAERTKHVHGLHPYLGKFVPQLVEAFLNRLWSTEGSVFDPFSGSGTTLVEANAFGARAIGCDVSAFNCLLARVKVGSYDRGALERALLETLETSHETTNDVGGGEPSEWLRAWYAPTALRELLAYRAAAERLEEPFRDVAFVILSRSARSARLTTHFDLDFPRAPVTTSYYCHKHRRTCRPVGEAGKFLRRYTADTLARIGAYAGLRAGVSAVVLHADARTVDVPERPDGVLTSPPYPGLIDYHEQHRYAYELLGLVDRRLEEIGPAVAGTSRAALRAYQDAMVAVFRNACLQTTPGAPVVIVVNDSRGLYPEILRRSGLVLEDELVRHVNRRTGRRAGEFFESVLVCRVG